MESNRLVAATPAAKPAAADGGGGSSTDTILNIVNIAFGAGMLGLPYAIQGGGFVSGILGLGVVLVWNFVCCSLLVSLRHEVLDARNNATKGSALAGEKGTPVSFAAVGQYAMGAAGTALVYISVVVTLLGAASAYFINANVLLRATHFYLNPGWSEDTAMYVNTIFYMLLMYPLTCIKSLAPLSKLSFPAIVALVAGFAVIIKMGLDMHGWPSVDEVFSWDALYIPQTFGGFSSFFGVAVFSYGATIIILEIQESMADTNEFVDSLKTSLWIIWVSYSILGGIALLIYQQAGAVSDNIMEELPGGTAAEEPLLLFITMATLFTYPLAMQPVASIFSQALIQAGFGEPTSSSVEGKYGAVGSEESGDVQLAVDAESNEKHLPPPIYYGLRAGLVLFTGVCATSVPNFGVVVSLLGSFAVTLGSFVLPPLFHMAVFGDRLTQKEMAADIALFVVGVATCIFCTATTAIGVFNGDD